MADQCEDTAHRAANPVAGASLVGDSTAMRALRRDLSAVAATTATVLITGETGVGKGLVARALHAASSRCEQRFVHLDCAALSSQIVESELFGHERGAFTGAIERRAGRFEHAAGGTLFLDEIGDLPGPLQAKLLRVLEDRCFERLGGNRTLPMTARIVAATTRNLRREVAAGHFRSDLFHRLDVLRLQVPPLRERVDDLGALIVAAALRRGIHPAPRFSDDALRRLSEHTWPGNVRELLNVVERISLLHGGAAVTASCLDGLLDDDGAGCAGEALRTVAHRSLREGPLDGTEQIASALRASGGNVAHAARRLGVPRTTLRRRIRRLGLE